MNQILAVAEATSKKTKQKKVKAPRNSRPVAIKPVVVFFAVAIIVLGIACIASGAYYLVGQAKANSSNAPIPTVDVEIKKNRVVLNISHDKGISRVLYSWNDGESATLYGRGQTSIQEELILPIGHNTLHLIVVDSTGKEAKYEKVFELTDEDLVEPEITVVQDGNATIKITAKDETAIAYMEYYWEGNEDEAVRIEATQEGQLIIEQKIEVMEGTNTLIVIAEDKNENVGQLEKTVVGAKKPKIELNREGDTIIITATDEQGVSTVAYTLNGTEYTVDGNGQKVVEVRQNLVDGSNEFVITVTNINTVIAQGRAVCDK